MAANFTIEQLEFLGARHPQQRPASAVHPEGGPTENPIWPRFETIEACQHEDRRRAAALRKFDEDLLSSAFDDDDAEWLFESSADELATLLDKIADPDRKSPAPRCLASALYLRNRRSGVLGAVLELGAAHPELERAWFIGRHPALQFRANARGSRVIAEARTRLDRHLQVSGASSVPGFLIAFLNGYFDPELERFQLQYRGLVMGNKVAALRPSVDFTSLPRGHRELAVALHPITDLRRHITRIMPSSWRERVAAASGKPPTTNRMRVREPYHSMYLMWLARRRLADLIVVDGAFYWDGGFKLRECYGGTQVGAHGGSTVSNLGQSIVAAAKQASPGRAKGAQRRQAKPHDVQRNQSARRSRRRVMAVFPNRTEALKRRDDLF